MTTEQKTVFDAEFLKWGKAVWEACQATQMILIAKKLQMRAATEAERKEGGYYEMSADARSAYDAKEAEGQKARKKLMTAAWLKDNKPDDGLGSDCSATDKCKDSTHCCGTATLTGQDE